ncbi:hypothetical protein HOLleu_11117 [Holothuria leucospilota]|uniref:Uncharacterized protein n=1 Tax=Holothuria leucospilota TaxID=206669 RepID=A0A9Q1HC50_HOLLE|nr:hypothetical protein HOLleu_11117 [Holothuria leucospilota]
MGSGYVRSHDFDDYLKDNPNPSLSISGLEVTVTIPFLARTPNGPPNYAFALTKFYQKSRGDIPKINVLYPYVPVDEITLIDNEAVVRNGNDEMRFSFNRMDQPNCSAPKSIVTEELQEILQNEFQFGLPSPEYSFCGRHGFESQFCRNDERDKCEVRRYAPNICQKWSSNDTVQCATTVAIENITTGFRDITLLGEDPINILASESYHQNFTLALKYPCED